MSFLYISMVWKYLFLRLFSLSVFVVRSTKSEKHSSPVLCGSGRTAFLTFLAVVKVGRKTRENVSKITTYFLQTKMMMTRSLAERVGWRMMKALRTIMMMIMEKPASRRETIMTKPSFSELGNPEHVTPWSHCAGNIWRHYARPRTTHSWLTCGQNQI